MQWKIYYDNGSTFSDVDGKPHEAPALGVQAVVQADSTVGRQVIQGRDFYYFEDGLWNSADVFGLWDYLCRPGAEKIVRFGRNMSSAHFHAVLKKASTDPDFPVKSAWYPDERPDLS